MPKSISDNRFLQFIFHQFLKTTHLRLGVFFFFFLSFFSLLYSYFSSLFIFLFFHPHIGLLHRCLHFSRPRIIIDTIIEKKRKRFRVLLGVAVVAMALDLQFNFILYTCTQSYYWLSYDFVA